MSGKQIIAIAVAAVDDLLAPPVQSVELVSVPVIDEETGKPKLDDNDEPLMKKEPRKVTKPAKKKITITLPKVGENGKIEVQEESALTAFGIKLYNLTVNNVIYEGKVKEQIDQHRKIKLLEQ